MSKESTNDLKNAKVLLDKGDLAAALELLRTVLAKEAKNVNALVLVGVVLQKMGDYRGSWEAYSEAIRLKPDLPSPKQGLIELVLWMESNNLEDQIQWDQLLPVLNTFLPSLGVDHAKFLMYQLKLAEAFFNCNQFDKAESLWIKQKNQYKASESGNLLKHFEIAKSQYFAHLHSSIKGEPKDYLPFGSTIEENAKIQKILKVPNDSILIKKIAQNQLIQKTSHDPFLGSERESKYFKEIESIVFQLNKTKQDNEEVTKTLNTILSFKLEYSILNSRNLERHLEDCMKLIQSIGNGPLPFETFSLLILSNETMETPALKYQPLVLKFCYYFPWKKIAWLLLARNYLLHQWTTEIPTIALNLEDILSQYFDRSLGNSSTRLEILELVLGYQCDALLNYQKKEYLKCISSARRSLESLKLLNLLVMKPFSCSWLTLHVLMGTCYFKLNKMDQAIQVFKHVLTIHPKNADSLRYLSIISFYKNNMNSALGFAQELFSLSSKDSWANAFLGWIDYQSSFPDIDNEYEYVTGEVDPQDMFKVIQSKKRLELAIEVENQRVDKNPLYGYYFYWLGRIYWAMSGNWRANENNAYNNFSMAIKVSMGLDFDKESERHEKNEYLKGVSVEWMGYYYNYIKKNPSTAEKCWEKALQYSPKLQRVGMILSDIYIKNSKKKAAMKLLLSIRNRGQDWPLRRLGILQMNFGKFDDAILSFQGVLRENTNSISCWNFLAEAYSRQGKLMAAIKVAEKVLSLHSDNVISSEESIYLWYTYFQLGKFNLKVGLVQEGEMYFEKVIEMYKKLFGSDHLPSLEGLASSHFQRALKFIESGLLSPAYIHLYKAETLLLSVLKPKKETGKEKQGVSKQGPDASRLTVLWKLLGDIYTNYSWFVSSTVSGRYSINLEDPIPSQNETVPDLTADKCILKLVEGSKAFQNAILTNRSMSSLYYDLGINYWQQYKFYCVKPIADNQKTKKSLLNQAVEQFKIAIKLLTTEISELSKIPMRISKRLSEYWNALGIAYIDQPQIQSHCFIKSLKLHPTNADALSNLSLLILPKISQSLKSPDFLFQPDTNEYLVINYFINMINQSQHLDPSLPLTWILQGLVLELMFSSLNNYSIPKGTKISLDNLDKLIVLPPPMLAFNQAFSLDQTNVQAVFGKVFFLFQTWVADRNPQLLNRISEALGYNGISEDLWLEIIYQLEIALKIDEKDPAALNIFGLILSNLDEKFRFSNKAISAFQSSYNILLEKKKNQPQSQQYDLFSIKEDSLQNMGIDKQLQIVGTNLAFSYLQKGAVEDALKTFTGLEKSFPVVLGLCECYARKGDKKKVQMHYDSALKLITNNPKKKFQSLLWISKLYFKYLDKEEAKSTLDNCCKEFPTEFNAWITNCIFSVLTKDLKKGRSALAKAYSIHHQSSSSPQEFGYREKILNVLDADLFVKEGNVKRAFCKLQSLIRISPYDSSLRTYMLHFANKFFWNSTVKNTLSNILVKTKTVETRRGRYDISDSYEALFSLSFFGGQVKTQTEEISMSSAIQSSQALVFLRPNDLDAWYYMGIAIFGNAVYQSFLKQESTMENFSLVVNILTNILSVFEGAKKQQMIRNGMDMDVNQKIFSIKLHLSSANIYLAQSNIEKREFYVQNAKSIIQNLLADTQNLSSQELSLLNREQARICLVEKKQEEAIKHFKTSIKIYPSLHQSWIELAFALWNQQLYSASEFVLNQYLVQLSKSSFNDGSFMITYIYMAQFYFQNNSFSLGSKTLDKALDLMFPNGIPAKGTEESTSPTPLPSIQTDAATSKETKQPEMKPGAQPSAQPQAQKTIPGQAQQPQKSTVPGQAQGKPVPGQAQQPQSQRPVPGQAQQPPKSVPGQSQPQKPVPGQPQQAPSKTIPGQPPKPVPGQAQQPQSPRPVPGQAQQPPKSAPGQTQKAIPGQAQQPPPKTTPAQSQPGQQPQKSTIPGQAQGKPVPGQAQQPQSPRPVPGQAQPSQPSKTVPGQPQKPVTPQAQPQKPTPKGPNTAPQPSPTPGPFQPTKPTPQEPQPTPEPEKKTPIPIDILPLELVFLKGILDLQCGRKTSSKTAFTILTSQEPYKSLCDQIGWTEK